MSPRQVGKAYHLPTPHTCKEESLRATLSVMLSSTNTGQHTDKLDRHDSSGIVEGLGPAVATAPMHELLLGGDVRWTDARGNHRAARCRQLNCAAAKTPVLVGEDGTQLVIDAGLRVLQPSPGQLTIWPGVLPRPAGRCWL